VDVTDEIRTVAVLGTGTMGAAMARRLLRAGFTVHAWDRTREQAEPLAQEGARIAASPAAAAAGAEAMITMLPDADVVEAVVAAGGALAALPDRGVWIQTSTVGVAGAERLAALAAQRRLGYLDAPVLGSREPAERGELVVMASGPEELRPRCARVFEAIGRRVLWVGPAGAGSRLKAVTNLWLTAITEAAAEAIALARALGLDPRLFIDAVTGTQVDAPYLHIKGEAMLARRYPPSFKLRLAAKDARLIVEAAERAGLDLPLAEVVRERFEQGVALGHGDDDIAATYEVSAAEMAGAVSPLQR
jgi:3-hydroxyisobutyrate dehydrogenase